MPNLSTTTLILTCALALASGQACIRGGGGAQIPSEEQWAAWQVLGPLLADAQHQVDEETFTALVESAELLVQDKAADARERLELAAAGAAPHWVAVAQADLAVMHFSRCIRGVAWRVENGPQTRREMDFSTETKLGALDISVEAILTRLDTAIEVSQERGAKSLLKHARIARARVTAYTAQCAPNDDVSAQANAVMRADLATLAAEAHLSPDLAYLWAAIQYESYSRQAARPFLLQAKEGGFADPSVDLLLAEIALESGNFVEAEARAAAAEDAYATIEAKFGRAQALVLRAESLRRREQHAEAKALYTSATRLDPQNIEARLGNTRITLVVDGPGAALHEMREQILILIGGELADEGDAQPTSVAEAAARLEALIISINEDLELASLCRSALLHEVDLDEDPLRRGLRYYFAATLDVALGDYAAGQGHAAAAELEFETAQVEVPEGITLLLERLAGLSG